MNLSDRLVEARFTKRADGRWEYSALPFLRCRILAEAQKAAIEHNLKLASPGLHLFVASLFFKWAVIFPVILILTSAARAGRDSPELTVALIAIPFLPSVLALFYIAYCLVRMTKSRSFVKVEIRNAEKGRRIGYLEGTRRTGRALGPVYTVLIIIAWVSALTFSAIFASIEDLFPGGFYTLAIASAVLLPLFWSELKSGEPRSSKD
ncbi:MAG: hypothetical protein IH944_13170 [Armatimonadetes bacterium]|nr:hypothetical protein [Armatimonadota bacterium]